MATYVLNMESRTIKFDYVFVGEAQDVTVAEEKLVEKVKGRGCRLVAVGDENQRINVWCGASKTAMDNFENAQIQSYSNCPHLSEYRRLERQLFMRIFLILKYTQQIMP